MQLSKSLYNPTTSPGWYGNEIEIFRLALIKYGIGSWRDIQNSGCLPGKQVSQLYSQLRTLLGQQSSAEFAGLHADPATIGRDIKKKSGIRKAGVLINTGDKLTREQLIVMQAAARSKYELPADLCSRICLPSEQPIDANHHDGKAREDGSGNGPIYSIHQLYQEYLAMIEQELSELNVEIEGRRAKEDDNDDAMRGVREGRQVMDGVSEGQQVMDGVKGHYSNDAMNGAKGQNSNESVSIDISNVALAMDI